MNVVFPAVFLHIGSFVGVVVVVALVHVDVSPAGIGGHQGRPFGHSLCPHVAAVLVGRGFDGGVGGGKGIARRIGNGNSDVVGGMAPGGDDGNGTGGAGGGDGGTTGAGNGHGDVPAFVDHGVHVLSHHGATTHSPIGLGSARGRL